MKTKLIILEQGNIIVSDEEIKQRDLLIWKNEIHRYHSDAGYGLKTYTDYSEKDGSSLVLNWSNLLGKLIASDNLEHNLPNIDYSHPMEKDGVIKTVGEWLGIIDVEKLSEDYAEEIYPIEECYGDSEDLAYRQNRKNNFIKGFKKSQSLNDKKFNLEDVRKITQAAFTIKSNNETLIEDFDKWFDIKIQSLQQPKVFDIEVEMEIWNQEGNITSLTTLKPKIINNSIKITKMF